MIQPFEAVRTLESIGLAFTPEQLAFVRDYNTRKNAEDRVAMAAWWSKSTNLGTCRVGSVPVQSRAQKELQMAITCGRNTAKNEMMENMRAKGMPENIIQAICSK